MMKRLFSTIAVAVVAATACFLHGAESVALQNGDLLFQANKSGNFSDAITDATGRQGGLSYTHVGIVAVGSDSTITVIEATSEKGVRPTPLKEFLDSSAHDSAGNPLVTVSRYPDKRIADRAVENARKFIGQPYDYSFLPSNGAMYCSELVYESFTDDAGNHLLKSAPMTFKDKTGRISDFWIKLFRSRNEPIPEGVTGTNPNDMHQDPALHTAGSYF